MKDSPEFIIDFIRCIKKHPCIWNTSLKEYNKRDVTDRAWKQIAEELNVEETSCRDRWKNIRCAFVRSRRLYQENTIGKLKKQYYLHDHLYFLLPYTNIKNGNELTSSEGSLGSSSDLASNFDDVSDKTLVPNMNNNFGKESFVEEVNKKYKLVSNGHIESSSRKEEINHVFSYDNTTLDKPLTPKMIKYLQKYSFDEEDNEKSKFESNVQIESSSRKEDVKHSFSCNDASLDKALTPTRINHLRKFSVDEENNEKSIKKPKLESHLQVEPLPRKEENFSYCDIATNTDNSVTNYNGNEDKDFLFFKIIMSDVKNLPEKKKRKFRKNVLDTLDALLDENEMLNTTGA